MIPALAWMLVAASGLWVAPSPDAEALSALLAEELGASALVSEREATFRVRLEARDGALELEVSAADGAPLVARRLEAASERRAVLRGAVLVIAQVVSRAAQGAASAARDDVDSARATDVATPVVAAPAVPAMTVRAEPTGTPALAGADSGAPPVASAPETPDDLRAASSVDPGALALWVGAAASVSLVGRAPQLGVEVAARGASDAGAALSFGASVGFDGLGCCELTSALASGEAGLAADRARVRGLASVGWRAWSAGPVAFELGGGAGVAWQRLTTRALAFQSSAPAAEVEAWSPWARVVARVGGPLADARLGWAVEVGAELGGALSAELPAGFPGRAEAIDTGFMSPFALLRLEWRAL